MKDSHKSVIVSFQDRQEPKGSANHSCVTQDMKYRQSLMCYARKYGVARASRKYNRPRSTIYFWLSRYDGTIESLANRSKWPHSYPNQHTEAELKLIRVYAAKKSMARFDRPVVQTAGTRIHSLSGKPVPGTEAYGRFA